MGPEIRQSFRALHNRIMLIVARATLNSTNDGNQMQTAQLGVLEDETRDNVERFQNYGFTCHPLPGAEAAVVFAGGNRDHGMVLAVDDRRYRLKSLAPGEVAIYTDEGDKVVLKRGRVVEITTETFRVNAGTKVELNAPTIELNGQTTRVNSTTTTVNATNSVTLNSPNSNATGHMADQNGTMQEMRDIYNGHNHGGVQTGGGTTNNPNQSMT